MSNLKTEREYTTIPNDTDVIDGCINLENLLKEYSKKCNMLNEIYLIINNALYLQDMTVTQSYNTMFEIADILEKNDDELGKYLIE